METIYLSLMAQVAEGTFFMKSPVLEFKAATKRDKRIFQKREPRRENAERLKRKNTFSIFIFSIFSFLHFPFSAPFSYSNFYLDFPKIVFFNPKLYIEVHSYCSLAQFKLLKGSNKKKNCGKESEVSIKHISNFVS